jgi:hypothetical protein
MSRLQERLQRLRRSGAAAGAVTGAAAEAVNGAAVDAGGETAAVWTSEMGSCVDEVADLGEAWRRLDAVLVRNEYGEFIRRTVRVPLDRMHGRIPLGTLVSEAEQLTSMLSQGVRASWEKLLFFDTETTGLGLGAGNVPFMVGFGYYRSDALIVEQCFLRSPADEPAMLAYFARVLGRFTHVVSYNGRAFDWPVLRNRYVMNRIDWSDDHLLQLDFLYPSRSLWKRILPSARSRLNGSATSVRKMCRVRWRRRCIFNTCNPGNRKSWRGYSFTTSGTFCRWPGWLLTSPAC